MRWSMGSNIPPLHTITGGRCLEYFQDCNQVNFSKPSREKYKYQRPHFLKLETEDEIQVTADHSVRPIIVPRDVSALPWSAGYAETINAGKSRHNEDQAMARQGSLGVLVGGNQSGHDNHRAHSSHNDNIGANNVLTVSGGDVS